jgi:predicted helicase
MTTAISQYLSRLDSDLKAGNATEHTHRPTLRTLIESLAANIIATNEPSRIACGSPDFIVTRNAVPLGYLEAKDVGTDLERTQDSEQLTRYRSSLRNLILTDYLEFRLYRNGEPFASARLGRIQKSGALRRDTEGAEQVQRLFQWFYDADIPTIHSSRELAERMARVARLMHDLIRNVFANEGRAGDLHGQFDAFKRVLISDLSVDQFADMYAQTIAYGLFAARCNHQAGHFAREHAGRELPKTNPFLRKLFNTIAGADLDDRVSWAVDDLAELLARADMESILKDFGHKTRKEDPVVHFYETFLSAYDPKLREMRGVYYTPEPVVDYIVRSVDSILKATFNLKHGLADKSQVKLAAPLLHGKAKSKIVETHRVQILDPALGTGTFLYSIIEHIRDTFKEAKGLWPSYVASHLLPRLYGFELLMAPYAVAHMKLGLALQESGYDFATDERLRVFLTNSLEEAHEHAGLPLFAQWLADEAAAASLVKREVPIMVIVGNPPYSGHSANKGPWIESLMEEYKKSAELKKPAQAKWLSDDYVKFIRFSQWRIEQTGYGVLGFITNHGWLDNPTFLDMRASLLASFDDLYVLNLHGNSKKNEVSPDGSKDENVFDIQQGVAICLLVKREIGTDKSDQHVHQADLWGARTSKYEWLLSHDVTNTPWRSFSPSAPKRLFVPQDQSTVVSYERGWSIPSAMDRNGDPAPGLLTTHDEFAISFTRDEAIAKVERLLSTATEGEAREIWRLCTQDQWGYDRAKSELVNNQWREKVIPILYRPFDVRWTIYDRNVAVHRRERLSDHLIKGDNLGFVVTRGVEAGGPWQHIFATNKVTGHHAVSIKEVNYIFPLWLDGEASSASLFHESGSSVRVRNSNFNSQFIAELRSRLGAVNPIQMFSFIYSVLYAPSYRERFAEVLRRDFPRFPMPGDRAQFTRLAAMGERLIDLHTMKEAASSEPGYPVPGNNRVERIEYKAGRVLINSEQYFDGVHEAVWAYYIGSYQPAQKWLKDRRGRLLTFDELSHYRRMVAAIEESILIQEDIDDALSL